MSNGTQKGVLNGNVYNSRRYETMNMITVRGIFGGDIQWFYTVKGIKLHRPFASLCCGNSCKKNLKFCVT